LWSGQQKFMRSKKTDKRLGPTGLRNACSCFLIKIRFQGVLYVEIFLVLLKLPLHLAQPCYNLYSCSTKLAGPISGSAFFLPADDPGRVVAPRSGAIFSPVETAEGGRCGGSRRERTRQIEGRSFDEVLPAACIASSSRNR